MAKLGAMRTPTPGCAATWPWSVRSRSSSQPVVPTTTCTPRSTQCATLDGEASGTENSTTTDAPSRSPRSSPTSNRPASSRSSAASTARHTSEPMRPEAPITLTRVVVVTRTSLEARSEAERGVLVERADHGEGPRPAGQVGRHGLQVLLGHALDARQHVVDRSVLAVDQLGLAEAGHPRAGVLHAEDEAAAHLADAARELLVVDAVLADALELGVEQLDDLLGLAGRAPGVEAHVAGVGVAGGERVDRVGQAPLLADLLEQPAAHPAAQDGVE